MRCGSFRSWEILRWRATIRADGRGLHPWGRSSVGDGERRAGRGCRNLTGTGRIAVTGIHPTGYVDCWRATAYRAIFCSITSYPTPRSSRAMISSSSPGLPRMIGRQRPGPGVIRRQQCSMRSPTMSPRAVAPPGLQRRQPPHGPGSRAGAPGCQQRHPACGRPPVSGCAGDNPPVGGGQTRASRRHPSAMCPCR